MQYVDLVLQTNDGWFDNLNAPAPPEHRFALSTDLYIGKPAPETAKIILDLAEPMGYQTVRPVRQYGFFYALVREVPGDPTIYEWDADGRLQTAVALSRLVRPTSISFRYAARVCFGDEGKVERAFPAWLRGIDPDSWLAPEENYRDWLIQEDFEELKNLLEKYSPSSLPPRISRALWYHEYASRTYYGEVCWMVVCTALESLLHTHRYNSTAQFTERLPQLASSVGIQVSKQEAETAYDMRSHLSHGGATGQIATPERQIYVNLGRVLRATLKLAVLDAQFAAIFADDKSVRSQWPISIRGAAI